MRCLAALLTVAIAGAPAPLSGQPPPAPAVAQKPAAATSTPAPAVRFDLARPKRAFDLPAALREISAITAVDDETVACVQDEQGVLFFVDVKDGTVRRSERFAPKGDYEGLARVGGGFYVLRSDGWLGRLDAGAGRHALVDVLMLDIPGSELEGLCFDPLSGHLLIAPKELAKEGQEAFSDEKVGGKQARDQRLLLGCDLERRAVLSEPVLRLSVERLGKEAVARGEPMPTRPDKKGRPKPELELRFSCVAVHPQSNDIYLLSAAEHALVAVDRQGKLRSVHLLDAGELPQPEGLTFLPGGDLVLSSEGVDGPGRVRVYGPQ